MSAKPNKRFPGPRIIQKPTPENNYTAIVECFGKNGRIHWSAKRIVKGKPAKIRFYIVSKVIFIRRGARKTGLFLSERNYDGVTDEFCTIFGVDKKDRRGCKIRGKYPTWAREEIRHRKPDFSAQRSFTFV